jgi:signal transduction histidine kinase
MQQRLRQLVVERGRALAAVSHDLRTPLTRMRCARSWSTTLPCSAS